MTRTFGNDLLGIGSFLKSDIERHPNREHCPFGFEGSYPTEDRFGLDHPVLDWLLENMPGKVGVYYNSAGDHWLLHPICDDWQTMPLEDFLAREYAKQRAEEEADKFPGLAYRD